MIIASIVFLWVVGLLYLFALCRAAALPLPRPSSGAFGHRLGEDARFGPSVPAAGSVHGVVF